MVCWQGECTVSGRPDTTNSQLPDSRGHFWRRSHCTWHAYYISRK